MRVLKHTIKKTNDSIKTRKIGCYFIVIKIKEKKKVSVQEQCLLSYILLIS